MSEIGSASKCSPVSNRKKSFRGQAVVFAGIILYTVFFSGVSFLRYDAFSYSDFDFAIFVHEYWKIAHGSANISIFLNVPIWGNAFELLSFLMAPLFALCNYNPKSLLLFQAFILGMGAWPVFLISRDKGLPERACVYFALSYLVNPSVWFSNLYEFNPLVFTTFGFLMMFYFYQRQRFVGFLICGLLCMMDRIDVGTIVWMFGLYAFVDRRPWRWVLTPMAVSTVWIVVGLFWIIPMFRGPLRYDAAYPQFGGSFAEILKNIFLHPQLFWSALATPDNAKYFHDILFPVLALPVLGLKQFLICAPSLIQHLISLRVAEHTIHYHYTATVTPFVYIAAIYAFARFPKFYRWLSVCLLPFIFSFLANTFYGPLSNWDYYIDLVKKNDLDRYKTKMLANIEPSAPVISSFEFSPRLAGRFSYYSMHYVAAGFFRRGLRYTAPEDIDYAVINFEDSRLSVFMHKDSDRLLRQFLEGRQFGVLDMAGNVVIFKKGYHGRFKIYEIKPRLENQNEQDILATANGLQLIGADVQKEKTADETFLNLTFHWTVTKPFSDVVKMIVSIRDPNNKEVYSDIRTLGYGLYPTKRWQPNEEVDDYFRLLIPKELKTGEYTIHMALFSKDAENRFYRLKPLDSPNRPYSPPFVFLNTFELP